MSTRPAASAGSSCSQNRSTVHPSASSRVSVSRSRSTVPSSFAAQKSALAVGRVAWVGPSRACGPADEQVDLEGRAVLPGFVDSHAHMVFAGDRSAEFAARMSGEPYSAGGIRSTVDRTRAATDDELRTTLTRLANEMRMSGITTFETKSGYGLTERDEARSLRLALSETTETTFLGAHVVPR